MLEERGARLLDVSGILGRQRTEVYGRGSYRGSSVLMHQMRAIPPSIAMDAMGHATHCSSVCTGEPPEHLRKW